MILANAYSKSRGFTIIELMITLVITSLLMIGAISLFTTAHNTGRVRTALSDLSVGGRFGLDQITRDIRMAGYRDSLWTEGPLLNSIVGVNANAATGGDVITLMYEGTRDCNFAVAPAGVVTNIYRVTASNLTCNGAQIASGIQELQLYFGEDTTSDGVANRWLSPGAVGLNMARVVAVRMHLLVSTNSNEISSGPQAYFFNNAIQPAIDDGQIRREYAVTVALRNPA
jgi:prepilin-type N-terminal cleavage/methylation domain-containing protein